MGYREEIIRVAKWWAEPGSYRPSADDFAWICQKAGLNVQPSQADLEYTTLHMPTGNMRVQGTSKSWCGIFAVAMWAYCGVGAKWTLNYTKSKGNVLTAPGLSWRKVWNHDGIQPGDIGSVAKYQHHFIITDVSANAVNSVDGNQDKNDVREYTNWKHKLSDIVAYYTISD